MLHKKQISFFICILLLGGAVVGGSYWMWTQIVSAPLAAKYQKYITANTTDNTAEHAIYDGFKGMDHPYRGKLPWENDAAFQAAIKKNQAPVLMAAFKAVLPVPFKSEGENIALAAKQLAGTVVQPGETFSQNQVLGPYTKDRGYREGPTYIGNHHTATVGGGVCKVATMLYNVATFSDLKVVMRHHHSMTVPYVPPGQDATVYYGCRDLRFLNNTGGSVVIWSQRVGNVLYMGFYGSQKPPLIKWHHRVENRTPFGVQYRYNGDLTPGTEKVVMPGQDGYVVHSWITVQKPDGSVEVRNKPTSTYQASPRIIERGPAVSDG